jgi:uncharacterized protein (DUF169 family)
LFDEESGVTDQLRSNEKVAKEYRETLQHEGSLVAVKLLKKSEIETIGQVKHPRPGNTFCQLIGQTHYWGRMHLIEPDDQACYAPPSIFGMRELPKEAWKRYVGWQVKTEEAGRKIFETMPSFPKGMYDAIFLSPLERCPVSPDVVIFFGNASQMLCIIAGYLADRGGSLKAEFCGMFSCGSLIVTPIQKGYPNIVVPGNPLRLLAVPDKELGCGIPGNILGALVENMKFLKARGGSQYPPAWPAVQMPAPPPISELLKPDGVPTWLKK